MYRTYVEVIMNMIPIIASIVIFGLYSAIEGEDAITSAKVYTVLSIFNMLSGPMRLSIITIQNFMSAQASLERIDHFIGFEEKKLTGIN